MGRIEWGRSCGRAGPFCDLWPVIGSMIMWNPVMKKLQWGLIWQFYNKCACLHSWDIRDKYKKKLKTNQRQMWCLREKCSEITFLMLPCKNDLLLESEQVQKQTQTTANCICIYIYSHFICVSLTFWAQTVLLLSSKTSTLCVHTSVWLVDPFNIGQPYNQGQRCASFNSGPQRWRSHDHLCHLFHHGCPQQSLSMLLLPFVTCTCWQLVYALFKRYCVIFTPICFLWPAWGSTFIRLWRFTCPNNHNLLCVSNNHRSTCGPHPPLISADLNC